MFIAKTIRNSVQRQILPFLLLISFTLLSCEDTYVNDDKVIEKNMLLRTTDYGYEYDFENDHVQGYLVWEEPLFSGAFDQSHNDTEAVFILTTATDTADLKRVCYDLFSAEGLQMAWREDSRINMQYWYYQHSHLTATCIFPDDLYFYYDGGQTFMPFSLLYYVVGTQSHRTLLVCFYNRNDYQCSAAYIAYGDGGDGEHEPITFTIPSYPEPLFMTDKWYQYVISY